MSNETEAFREAVANWCKATNCKVDELAKMVNCHVSTLQKFMNRDTTNITFQRAIDISRIIGHEISI